MCQSSSESSLATRTTAILIAAAREADLTTTHWGILACIAESPGQSVKHTAEYLGIAKAVISVRVEDLVRANLVARTEDPTDRRRVRLTLTDAGMALLRRVEDATGL